MVRRIGLLGLGMWWLWNAANHTKAGSRIGRGYFQMHAVPPPRFASRSWALDRRLVACRGVGPRD